MGTAEERQKYGEDNMKNVIALHATACGWVLKRWEIRSMMATFAIELMVVRPRRWR